MLAILSPAKTLDFESDLPEVDATDPVFLREADGIADRLAEMNREQLGELMSISENLADLNYQRYQDWEKNAGDDAARPALFTYAGDVYDGLDAGQFDAEDIDYAQQSLRVLSGLYGVVRPKDRIQAYRLEMKTAINPGDSDSLAGYWRPKVTGQLNQDLAAGDHAALVNLASTEYFKAVDTDELARPVIDVQFKEESDGKKRVIAIYAKRARGMMARYMVKNRVDTTDALKDFNEADYAFDADLSDEQSLVFSRPKP